MASLGDLLKWHKLTANPFASKEAGREEHLVQPLFVDNPAFSSILNEDPDNNTILYAQRGAGKSMSCLMFESQCREQAKKLRPLIITWKNWMPLIDYIDRPASERFQVYSDELLRLLVVALADQLDQPWVTQSTTHDHTYTLAQLVTTHGDYLSDIAQAKLLEHTIFSEEDAIFTPRRLSSNPRHMLLKQVTQALQGIGFLRCLVLVDRVDELPTTVADPAAGAELMVPLLAHLPFLETPGMAFKFFLPTAIITTLRSSRRLRSDRVYPQSLEWNGEAGRQLLRRMLSLRLEHYSQGGILSLTQIAESGAIEDELIAAARGLPRRLLNLGEQLLVSRARDATADDIMLGQRHLAAAIEAVATTETDDGFATSPVIAPPISPAFDGDQAELAASDQEHVATLPDLSIMAGTPDDVQEPKSLATTTTPPAGTQSAVPLLSLRGDGRVLRGDEPIPGSDKLPGLQRKLLVYLYELNGKMCHMEDLRTDVWRNHDTVEDSIRKLVDRLIRFLEVDPGEPRYLRKLAGGYYVLENTDRSKINRC